MSDVIIKYDTKEWTMIRHVFLDGCLQPRVESVNFTQGSIVRPYTGACLNDDQVKLPSGYVFDIMEDDFILETAYGDIAIAWVDKIIGQAWVRRHAQ